MPPEERKRQNLNDPMCELFPKQIGCYYSRYGLGGGPDSRHAMCILGLNMINDKVFVVVWVWHLFLVIMGCIRLSTRTLQLCSYRIRFFLLKMKMSRYFKKNAHLKHIIHYVHNCSIGDWFVIYQMSKNLNKRFFAEFLALLAMTVDPDPNIEPEEPEINLSPEDIEKLRASGSSSSNEASGPAKKVKLEETDDDDDDDEEEEGTTKRGLMNLDESLMEEGGGGGGGSTSLSGKQRMLIKLGKHAKSANKKAMMAAAAMRRSKR